ncbi:MAG: glutathione binding-like protein [Phenylobacterium sp.]|uniref:glutathione binding-like protein n=1 Tax=Phenylobacterium sp. TaxID=1871053 RepID=UPI002733C123|nr:glutathione binding-like protein [Phenylobacterium sp.]MDP3175859.1 glutathione binding-like protein [Phenylobacterium sp.]
MKLYFAPGACSLADHIAMHEAGIAFEPVKVDTRKHVTESGADFMAVNPKGYVPVLEFDDGQRLTENIAILSWTAQQSPALAPKDEMARLRLLESLAFISTELHKQFKPLFMPTSTPDEKARQSDLIAKRLEFVAGQMTDDYLSGPNVSVADAYLFVMLRWSKALGVKIPDKLVAYMDRMAERPAVKTALQHEGLS